MRDSLVFYRSFAEAIEELDEKDQLEALWAVIRYGLDMKEPDCSGASKAVFLMAKPQIDANIKRYQNGTKGGRPRASKDKKQNQEETDDEPNENDNEKENVNENVNHSSRKTDETEIVSEFILKDGSMFGITRKDLVYYQGLYPDVNCELEFKKIAGWCYAKKSGRKTREAAAQFVNSWLNRAQSEVKTVVKNEAVDNGKKKKNSFHNYDQRVYNWDDLQRRITQIKGDKSNEQHMDDGNTG